MLQEAVDGKTDTVVDAAVVVGMQEAERMGVVGNVDVEMDVDVVKGTVDVDNELASTDPTIANTTSSMIRSPNAKIRSHKSKAKIPGKAKANGKRRRGVSFHGAQVIEYDAQCAPIVRRCGVGRLSTALPTTTGSSNQNPTVDVAASTPSNDLETLELEWKARGHRMLLGAAKENLRAQLEEDYKQELRDVIQSRGFPCIDEQLTTLQQQLDATELLLDSTTLSLEPRSGSDTNTNVATSNKSVAHVGTNYPDLPTLLAATDKKQRSQAVLHRKTSALASEAEGYAFGRRFFTVEAYLMTLDLDELGELAREHSIPVPKAKLPKTKPKDSELISLFSETGAGKPLKMLTFQELVEEASARGLELPGRQRRSKPLWIQLLRPIMQVEVLAMRWRVNAEDQLRQQLSEVLEKEMQEAQDQQIIALLRRLLPSELLEKASEQQEDQQKQPQMQEPEPSQNQDAEDAADQQKEKQTDADEDAGHRAIVTYLRAVLRHLIERSEESAK